MESHVCLPSPLLLENESGGRTSWALCKIVGFSLTQISAVLICWATASISVILVWFIGSSMLSWLQCHTSTVYACYVQEHFGMSSYADRD